MKTEKKGSENPKFTKILRKQIVVKVIKALAARIWTQEHATGHIQKANRRKYITEALKRGEAVVAEGSRIESRKKILKLKTCLNTRQRIGQAKNRLKKDDRTNIIATNVVLD